MKITQLSIFLENKEGRLAEICNILGKNQINIRALSIAENEGFGILRMVVNEPEKAMAALKAKDIVCNITEIVAVEVADQPGGLAKVLDVLHHNKINVEYMYGFVEKFSENALLVFRFDDTDKAIKVLLDNKVRVIGKKDLTSL
jgi:hypothetical protein